MATKKAAPLATQSADELKAEVVKLQAELAETKRSHAAKELTNTRRLGELRRSIARAYTALSDLEPEVEIAPTTLRSTSSAQTSIKEKKS